MLHQLWISTNHEGPGNKGSREHIALKNHQYHFEGYLRYLILWLVELYWECGIILLVITIKELLTSIGPTPLYGFRAWKLIESDIWAP